MATDKPRPPPPNPDHLNDDDFLAWCQDDSLPLHVRGAAYLRRTMQADVVPTLTAYHAKLWTAIQLADETALAKLGALAGTPTDGDPTDTAAAPRLTPAATLAFFEILAVRHATDA